MERLSLGPNGNTYRKLEAAYAENHRHYHTAEHIDQCLALLREYRDLAVNADEVELALLFHDAIYKPMSKSNEVDSAAWAHEFMVANAMDLPVADRVSEFILATIHEAQPANRDAQLLVDIDLSVLGSSDAQFEQFEIGVRREYKWVPGPLYRRERRRILQSFIDRDSIYCTAELSSRFESRARKNLAHAIRTLQS